jgi:hypothetical protein
MKRGGKSDCERLAEFLEKNARYPNVVSYRRLYRLGIMVHSRVANLRTRGYDIRVLRDGSDYLYQLRRAPRKKAA